MRHLTNLIAMAFMGLMIAGCTGECEDPEAASCTAETDVDTDTDTDTDSDTDTDADADYGTLEVVATINGAAEDCTANYSGPQSGEFNTATEPSRDVKVGEYDVTVGTGDCGGVPCHTDANGNTRVSPKQTAAVSKNATASLEYSLAIYFDGRYSCNRKLYAYDDSKSDFKGAQAADLYDNKQRIQVIDGYKLKAYDKPNMYGPVGIGGNYMKIENDEEHGDFLSLVEVGSLYGTYILSSSIGPDFFEASFIEEPFAVTDLRCEL